MDSYALKEGSENLKINRVFGTPFHADSAPDLTREKKCETLNHVQSSNYD